MSIDWSKAQEGYDYHLKGKSGVGDGKFYRATHDRFRSETGGYVLYADLHENIFSITSRPSSPAWNGEGLPPVGTVCECIFPAGSWRDVFIVAHDAENAVYRINNQESESYFGDVAAMFRPIRTAEQIEAEKKQNEWLSGIAAEYDQETADKCAAVLVAGGYRKQEQK